MNITEITDDLTGAADSSSYFAARGQSVRICISEEADFEREKEEQILSVNLASRNIAPENAEEKHTAVMKRLGTDLDTVWMKKIGTGFRGHDGAELYGLLKAAPEHLVFIVDHAPDLGTFTLYGHQYCEGEILPKSLYARDPILPPTKSYIPEILAEECPFPIGLVDIDAVKGGKIRQATEALVQAGKRIIVFDAITKSDTLHILQELTPLYTKVFWTGSLGIADGLGEFWYGPWKAIRQPVKEARCLGFCASAYEICRKQLAYSESQGLQLVRLDIDSVINGRADVLERTIKEALEKNAHGNVMVIPEVKEYSYQPGTSQVILEQIGLAADALLPGAEYDRLILIGGETAQTVLGRGFAQHLLLDHPLEPGVAQGIIEGGCCNGVEFALKGGSMGSLEVIEKMMGRREVSY